MRPHQPNIHGRARCVLSWVLHTSEKTLKVQEVVPALGDNPLLPLTLTQAAQNANGDATQGPPPVGFKNPETGEKPQEVSWDLGRELGFFLLYPSFLELQLMPGPRVDIGGQKVNRIKFLKPLAATGKLKERYRALESPRAPSLSAVMDLGRIALNGREGTTMQSSRTRGSTWNQSPNISKLRFISP